ncbi:MAG: divergent polysaccharide deacetylase family protein [Alphaproteobacteria bacterium]
MSISDATGFPSSLSPAKDVSAGHSSHRIFFGLMIAGSLALSIIAFALAWHSGWFRVPPLPTVTVPIEWPQDPLITATSRRTLTSHGLAPAPDPRLIEIIPDGVLPIRAADGATPLNVYARPMPPQSSTAAKTPSVSLILRGAGIGQLVTLEASLRLPGEMSFALSPYAREIDRQVDEIREEGHEVLLDIPIMARDQNYEDTGPKALIPAAPEAENHSRLKWSMARVAGYAGLLAVSGSDSVISGDLKDLLTKQAETRGLGLITGSRLEPSTPLSQSEQASINVLIGRDIPATQIDNALERLTAEAKRNGSAIGVAVITPLAIERLKKWSEGLAAQGVRLVPASAVLLRTGQ